MGTMIGDKPMVVCVDDEPMVGRSLARLLSREPYDVVIAETPKEALSYVRDYEVDLVIADQRMPGMSGVELLEEVRQLSPSTGGLILTAYPESVMADDPPDRAGLPLFAKPWDDDTLKESIRELVKRKPEAPRAVRSVLVPVDGSIAPELSLGSVLPILKRGPVRITLLQVLTRLGLHRDVYAYLERTREKLAEEGVDAVGDVRWGDPAEQILLHARHANADLIVLPQEIGGGWQRRFRRGLAERILDGSDVPVLVGRPDLKAREFHRILVPLDGSREAEAVLSDAVEVARQSGAAMDLVGVDSPQVQWGYGAYAANLASAEDRPRYLAEMATLIGLGEVAAEVHLSEGDPAREILRLASALGADLICLSCRARRRRPFLGGGGVLRKVLQRSRCPVYVRKARSSAG